MDESQIEAKFKALDDRLDGLSAKYVKADSWFQKYRREHPIATQNILFFGGLIVGTFSGLLVGKVFL